MKEETKKQESQAVEIPDGERMEIGADYGVHDAFNVVGGQREYHYFLAADDGDTSRPDGVHQLRLRGYVDADKSEVCVGGGDCRLMKIKREVFEGRRKAKRDARINAKRARRKPQGVPEDALVETGNPNRTPTEHVS